MEEGLTRERDQQIALTQAFEAACAALNIGPGSLDVWRKERLAHILEVLSLTDGWEWPTLKQQAIAAFLSESSEATGPSEPSACGAEDLGEPLAR